MSNEVLVPPDLDAALIAWAPDALAARGFAGFTAAAELAGDDTLAIYTTGGVELLNGILDTPTVIVEASASTITRGNRALQMLRGLIRSLVGGYIPGSQVWLQEYGEFAGPAWLPVDDHPNRNTMTLSLTVSAQVL